jgi:hypothetical protein
MRAEDSKFKKQHVEPDELRTTPISNLHVHVPLFKQPLRNVASVSIPGHQFLRAFDPTYISGESFSRFAIISNSVGPSGMGAGG